MKPAVRVLLPIVILLGVATGVMAAAEPIEPTTPYPPPAAGAPACAAKGLAVQEAQAEYKYAKSMYELEKELYDAGTGSPSSLWGADKELQVAGIALNEAKYAELVCRNEKGKAEDKVCVGLALQLNKLIDELSMRKALGTGANREYNRVVTASMAGVEGKKALAAALRDSEKFEATKKRVEQEIQDLRDSIKNNPACAKFDPERPAPKPPAPTSSTTEPIATSTTTEPTATEFPATSTAARVG